MKTLYDVQQLLKKFNIYVYVGKRLWDIEVMALELDKLHQARLITQREFIQAKLILTQQHRIEEQKSNGSDS
ncbi:YqgQ family protein [Lentilactobacillus kribbianus]|uniref:YqgQ family protein n=1 Tax=Lentilactobacillus kribbianus TaxID=2729622 RepID=UPI001557D58B|nr:YqgQ family protein [Lentilactobacillus kribbianus]